MTKPNFYADVALDRAAHLRDDADWLAASLAAPGTVIIPVWRARNLVVEGEAPRAVLLPLARAAALVAAARETVLLGLQGETAYFAVDLSHLDDPSGLPIDEGSFIDLRLVGALLGRGEAGLLAYAKGILHWHSRHRFCGACGAPTMVRAAGHMRICTSAQCARPHFPRTDPAVIMLVSDGVRALLGRKAEWPQGMYSTLAGFVEPGESLEQTVAREVAEEAGVMVTDIRYHSSQPWPFPASLMVGFFARTSATEFHMNPDELEDLRWFSRDELAAGGAGIARRPRSDSIARRLINAWLRGDEPR
jgi:NAD+ diphosphatase